MENSPPRPRSRAAVEADRLYALTHGDFEDGARHRAEGILAALDDRSWPDNDVEAAGDE